MKNSLYKNLIKNVPKTTLRSVDKSKNLLTCQKQNTTAKTNSVHILII